MKHRAAFLVWSVLLAGASSLDAQLVVRTDSGSVIETQGKGEIVLSPDRAEIRLMVQSRSPTAAAAASANATRLERVLDSLNAGKQATDSIQVVGVSVHPNEDFQRGDLTDYTATASIRIRLRSVNRVGEILDRALRNGATSVSGVRYDSDRSEAARSDALARAFEEAKSKAEALARAAGVRLGPVLRIASDENSPFDGFLEGASVTDMLSLRGGSAPISPQDVMVRESVRVVWRIQR